MLALHPARVDPQDRVCFLEEDAWEEVVRLGRQAGFHGVQETDNIVDSFAADALRTGLPRVLDQADPEHREAVERVAAFAQGPGRVGWGIERRYERTPRRTRLKPFEQSESALPVKSTRYLHEKLQGCLYQPFPGEPIHI